MEERNYIVYRHTAPNGKMYVGITRCQPEERWKRDGSGYKRQPRFFNAIKKYGWSNFEHEVLMEGLTQEEASLAERLFIGCWKTNDKNYGYNLANGGSNFWGHSEETKVRLSESKRGCNNPMYGMRGKNAPMYGRRHTEEAKQKNRLAHLGKRHTKASKQKMSDNRSNEKSTNKKAVYCVELDKVFWGAKEAWMELGVNRTSICMACKGQRETAGGYHWEYYKKEERRSAI